MTLLLEEGPISATQVGSRLGISAAGVRRHLDALIDAGDARVTMTSRPGARTRGRPAKLFSLTAHGRSRLGHSYDDLAGAAMRHLREIGGDDAVRTFARRRIQSIVGDVEPADTSSQQSVSETADAIAEALTESGFAASTRPVGNGVQICQHHCPVSHVAAEFPELCTAEREAFADLLGTHVQRLATIANGDCACTTHVPLRTLSTPESGNTDDDVGVAPSDAADSGTVHHDRTALDSARTNQLQPEQPARSSPEGARMTVTPDQVTPTVPATLTQDETIASLGTYGYGWSDSDVAGASAKRGISDAVVRDISDKKSEPEWMLEARLKALRTFERKPMPNWGSNLDGIDFDNIKYFVRSSEKQAATWDDLPADIKNTYDRLGIPEAEKQRLVSGVAAQYESEVVYHSIREDLEEQGVIFLDTDSGLREHPELFQEYFGSVIPAGDNKFSALNTAVWSGGSFIYVPPGVHVDIPLQAYFRINTENMGQFERTLIIVDEGAYVHYVEGCTAPIYKSDSLHSAVVEIIVKKGGRCRYTTIQNWSNNVYNLVTKRAKAEAGATMEWIDGNIGSKVTMKYPAVWMTGEHAKGEVLSVAFAGEGQHQDTGSKMLHLAPNTSSNIVSKSVARGGGRASYRGLIQINKGAHGSKSTVKCDALLVDQISRSDTYPYVDIREDDVTMGHEATVSKVSDDQLFYLMSRGMTEDEAMAMVVRGFVEPIAKELPMEYALELNRLIELQMEGSVG
ncbi:FeS assembly protein SufB [Rhodococcus sp. SORGH_AS303]|nr:FeS assembly protein SufB [Rhodococcus sp. SORGH_AS_0303]